MWAVNASGSLTARAVPRLLAFDVHIADTDAAEPTGREQVWTVAAVAVNMAFAPYTDRLLALAHPTALLVYDVLDRRVLRTIALERPTSFLWVKGRPFLCLWDGTRVVQRTSRYDTDSRTFVCSARVTACAAAHGLVVMGTGTGQLRMAPQLKLGKSTYVQFADGTPVVACDVDTRAVVAATTAGTVYVVSVQYTSGGHVQECRLLTRTVVAGQPRHVAICPLNQWAIVTSDASVRWLQLTNAGPHDVPDSDAVLVGPPRWTYVCSDKRPLVAAMDQHNRVVFLSPRRKCLPAIDGVHGLPIDAFAVNSLAPRKLHLLSDDVRLCLHWSPCMVSRLGAAMVYALDSTRRRLTRRGRWLPTELVHMIIVEFNVISPDRRSQHLGINGDW